MVHNISEVVTELPIVPFKYHNNKFKGVLMKKLFFITSFVNNLYRRKKSNRRVNMFPEKFL